VAKILKKYNLSGKEVGSVQVADHLANAEVNSQLVKDYITAIRRNERQWSANTKGRSEVNHSTKKPHPQKGGGRSRQGSLAAPHYKGGGRVFAPKPKFDQHVRINQKERQQAVAALLGEKIRDDRFIVVDSFEMSAPKTKQMNEFLKKLTKGSRPLFLGEGSFAVVDGKKQTSVQSEKHRHAKMSVRNIPKAEFLLARDSSGYNLMIAHDIIITEAALRELEQSLMQAVKE
jgi:large subunit ribosomal protein L4